MGLSTSAAMIHPSPQTRWIHVATSDQVGVLVNLPRIGYLRELLWLTAVNDRIVRRSEKVNPPKLLQVAGDEAIFAVAMDPGELWMCISDVLPGGVAAKGAVNGT